MGQFAGKIFNEKVFQKYLKKVPNPHLNQFMKNGIFETNQSIASRLRDGVGGDYVIEPIKGELKGKVVNYDGQTDLETDSRETYMQGKVIWGRAYGFEEKDFTTEITGQNFMPYASMSGEVGEFIQGEEQKMLLSLLKGIYSMTDTKGAEFIKKHTYDITEKKEKIFGASTLNRAITQAGGDKKSIYKMVFMHSNVAADLEDLQLIKYFTYTNANGIQVDLALGTVNGRVVIIDDDCPVEIDEENGDTYTSYVMGKGFIEYADCGAKVPVETVRDAETAGGIDKLYVRTRKMWAPKFISFTKAKMSTLSPTNAEIEDGTNWEIVNNGKTGAEKKYINDKFIPIARILSKAGPEIAETQNVQNNSRSSKN